MYLGRGRTQEYRDWLAPLRWQSNSTWGIDKGEAPMARTNLKSVDEYIAAQPAHVQKALRQVRTAIRKAVPDAEEAISYQIPVFKRNGSYVIYFAGWKQHYSLYPANARLVAKFKRQLSTYEISKGTIRFPLSEPVPAKLISAIAKFLSTEAADRTKAKPTETNGSPERQLKAFIDKFDAKDQKLIRSVRSAMRRRLPTAHELVYDNYNFFVIGYSPTERPSEAIFSIAARANGMGLCFLHGAGLPDPKKLLQGSGNRTRFIRLRSASELARPEVEALMAAAIARSKAPLSKTGRGKLIIRSVSAKQRPRRRTSE
jgi:uncharacterized protein YdhG (YjbR/CyaY superfamily)